MRRIITLFQENAFVRNSLILFMGAMAANVLNYVFHLLVARMVSPEAYGEIESLISLLVIVSVPAGTLELIATKRGAQMRAFGDIRGTYEFSKYLVRKIVLYGMPLFLVAILLTPALKNFLHTENTFSIMLIWGVMFLSFLSSGTAGILTGWQRFYQTSYVGTLAALIKLIFAGTVLYLGFATGGIVGSYLISTIFMYVANLYLLRRYFKKTTPLEKGVIETGNEARMVKGDALPIFLGTFSLAILGNVDMIFAKHHLEAFTAGEYGALSIAAKTIFFATGVLTTVLFAMSAEEHHKKESEQRTFRLAIWLTLLVTIISIIFFSLFPSAIVSLLFGEEYLGISQMLPWFALSVSIYSFANLFLQYLLSRHETHITLFFLALAGLEMLILFFFGGNFYAIIGITICTQVVAALLGFWFVLKRKRYVKEDLGSYTGL